MKVSLEFFVKIPSTLPKAMILGDMKELGDISIEEHKKLIDFVKTQNIEKIYLVGSIFKQLAPSPSDGSPIEVFENIDQLNKVLQEQPLKGYYILLKGSHSIRLDKAIPFL